MITATSRYRQHEQQVRLTSDGRSVVEIEPKARTAWAFEFAYYRWRSNDRIDNLAYEQYRDCGLWWAIADANPEIMDWSDVPYGTIIRIPRVL